MIIYDWFYEFSPRSRRSRVRRCRTVSFRSSRLSRAISTDEVEEGGEPHDSESIAVDAANQPSVNEEFLDTSVHVVKVELLVAGGAGVDDAALSETGVTLS